MSLLNKKNNRGITLYFSLIIISALMLMGFFVIELARKEVIFSSYGRESQIAFYAAESGLECAWYFDQQDNYFYDGVGDGPRCGYMIGDLTQDSGVTEFKFALTQEPNSSCAEVKVEVGTVSVTVPGSDGEPTSQEVRGNTVITSRGINTCDEISNRRFERAIELKY